MNSRKISDIFIESNLQHSVVDDPISVMFQVRTWTKGQLELTELILSQIINKRFLVANGQEKERVEEFVRSHVIEKWQEKAAANHLNGIRYEIVNHPAKNKILLKLYSILGEEEVSTNTSAEVQALLKSSLVVEKAGVLSLHNPIYESVFTQHWIEKELETAQQASSVSERQPPVVSSPSSAAVSSTAITEAPAPSAAAVSAAPKKESSPSKYFKARFLVPLAASLVLVGIFISCQRQGSFSPTGDSGGGRELVDPDQPDKLTEEALQGSISGGERILIEEEEISGENLGFRTEKAKGVAAMAVGDSDAASVHFEQALNYYKNAPETLIYLNNARADLKSQDVKYTIAAAVPLSNDLPAAQGMLRGVAQAQNRINEGGGINGVPLSVKIVNDHGQKEFAPQIAELMTDDSEILGVVGHHYSSVTLAAEETYKEKGLPIITLGSATDISGLDNDFLFRISPSDQVMGQALANYMLTSWNKDKIAIFYNRDNAYSSSLKRAFESTVITEGGTVISDFDWSSEDFSIAKAFDSAVEQGAQVLMLVPADNEELIEKVIPLAQLNSRTAAPLDLMGGDVTLSAAALEKDFEGMIVGAFWHITSADQSSEFIVQSEQLWDAEVNWVTAMSYDATQVWIEALKKSTSTPTRAELQSIMSSEDEPFSAAGASEEIRFLGNGDRPIRGQLVRVVIDATSTEDRYRFEAIVDNE